MKELITETQARLTAEVRQLKYIDEDWGQLDYYAPQPPVSWPCSLIDVVNGTFSNNGKLQQMGLLTVKIRVADMKLTNSSSRAPQAQKDKAFSIFDLIGTVHLVLHGWQPAEAYTALIRSTFARVKRNDGVQLYEMQYTTEWKDASTSHAGIVTAAPVVKLGVTLQK